MIYLCPSWTGNVDTFTHLCPASRERRAESFFVSASPQLPSAQNHSYAKVAYLGAVHSATLIALWVGSQLPILGHHCSNLISTSLSFFGDCEPSPSTSCLDHTGFSDSGRWCHPLYPYSGIPEVVSRGWSDHVKRHVNRQKERTPEAHRSPPDGRVCGLGALGHASSPVLCCWEFRTNYKYDQWSFIPNLNICSLLCPTLIWGVGVEDIWDKWAGRSQEETAEKPIFQFGWPVDCQPQLLSPPPKTWLPIDQKLHCYLFHWRELTGLVEEDCQINAQQLFINSFRLLDYIGVMMIFIEGDEIIY